jgi:endonuclease/exonuclease/phosphatase family metal-dependent hydrolase/glycosyltransferase involved in cell wall biosynthesis
VNILMMTNTYLPHVGGVARSVASFAAEYRRRGHRVLIVAPEFENRPAEEADVVRIPAIQNFNGSDFSVRLPIPGILTKHLDSFNPHIVHSHHPFLLGDTAVRVAAARNLPLVFTHHTMYERYTHYAPVDSPVLAHFIVDLVLGYTDLCDAVVAPSESVAELLKARSVVTPIEVLPTGIDTAQFARGDGGNLRQALGVSLDALVVGHVGRLAPEKNLTFLSQAVTKFLQRHRRAHFLVVGGGPSEEVLRQVFHSAGLQDRLHLVGSLQGQPLVDAYHAMDVFAFASRSETQGMVLIEAMAAGVPVVAIDAPGAREVVIDGVNGRLLPTPIVRSFVQALAWVANQSPSQRQQLSAAAVARADEFSMSRMADKALRLYAALVEKGGRKKTSEHSEWETVARLIRTEWELWSNVAQAATAAMQSPQVVQVPFIGPTVRGWRAIRRWFSHSGWGAKLLGLPLSESSSEHGLILVQIDGLSRFHLERAMARRQLPFLRKLLARGDLELHTHYSGLPSATAAVQAELFYGVKSAVPAHGFGDRSTQQIREMSDLELASQVQQRLARGRVALLAGGSAYCDIYTGGAAEPHFCAASTGWGELLRYANPLKILAFCLWNICSLCRTLGVVLLELVLVLVDCIRGLVSPRDLLREVKFIPSRVGVSVLLRELMTISAGIDIERGMPIIHLNHLGYDEQAHHRGPGSIRAYWSLRGIDRAIRRVWRAASQSSRRDYTMWIYSDHGQEQVTPYVIATGRTIEEAIQAVLQESGLTGSVTIRDNRRSRQLNHAGLFRGRASQLNRSSSVLQTGDVLVAAVGPLGHIYLADDVSSEQLDQICQRLTTSAHIPLALTAHGGLPVRAWTEAGQFQLPRDAAALLGENHPFMTEAAQDLAELCQHPLAGDIVIGGWCFGREPLSFADEWGAHGGVGPRETSGFVALSSNVAQIEKSRAYLRPSDLRRLALQHLRGGHALRENLHRESGRGELRILTYNVHSCVGLDGKLSISRIARVLAQCDADIVALQELDVRQVRTGLADQAHELAQCLGMKFQFFHPTRTNGTEHFGNAVLSRLPLRLVRAGTLPGDDLRAGREPRNVIWVAIEMEGGEVQLLNTHLGLLTQERLRQVETLLGPEWLTHPECRNPVIVCGDFNMRPGSLPYRRLRTQLRDAQQSLSGHRPKGTWLSPFPIRRIDHVFLSPGLEVASIQVPANHLARIASDHLPLVVDLHVQWSRTLPTDRPLGRGIAHLNVPNC